MAKALRERVGQQYKGTQRTRKAVHGECTVELAKWTFPVISLSREPYEAKVSRTGLTGGMGRRTARQRALCLPSNPVVSRTIEIWADQTLADLQMAIFKAFDRAEQHMYEFQVGGKGPQDPQAQCYVLPMAMKDTFGGSKPAGDVTRTRLGSLGFKVDDAFGYWFDFGDDWWHQIKIG